MKKGILSSKRHVAVFVLPALICFVVFLILPLILTGFYSFFEYNGVGNMKFIGLGNYIKMFAQDKYFPNAVLNSLVLAFASVLIQLPISFILALILARGVKGESFFRTIYFIPVVISSMVIGQLWLRIFRSDYGLLNVLISKLTGTQFEFTWLTNKKTAFLTTVVPALWQYIGYHMLIFYAGIKSLPVDYFEAASLEGASHTTVTFKIVVPLLSTVIRTCIVFAMTGAFRAFDLIYIMTGGGPNHVSEVPATLMYSNLFKKGLYGYGSAQAFFIVLECFLFSYILFKIFKKSEDAVSEV